MQFLTVLPGGRPQLWRAKVIAGVITMALSLLLIVVCYSATVMVIYGPAGLIPIESALSPVPHQGQLSPAEKVGDQVATVLLLAAYGYSVCFFASTLFDRSLVAAVIGVVGGIAIVIPFVSWATSILPQAAFQAEMLLMIGAIAGLTAIFAAASYRGFCSGNSLIVGTRMKRGLTAVGVGLAVMIVIMLTCQTVMVRAYAAQQALYSKTIPQITSHEMPDSGAYWNHLTIHAEFQPDNRLGIRIYVMLANPRQNMRQMSDALSTWHSNPDTSFYQDIMLSHRAMAAYVDPVSVTGGNAFFQASLIQPNCVEISLHPQQAPGTTHDTVHIVDKAGRSLGAIDVEKVTL